MKASYTLNNYSRTMNKLFYILFLLPLLGIGQTVDKNYVLSYTYRDPVTASDLTKTRANITYYDGLGRPIQQIAGKQSGTGTDVITHIEYDIYGRQAKEYLPYAATTANLAFDGAAKTNTQSFYNTAAFENTTNPYSRSFFEASPLNRVLKQASPGNIWVGDTLSEADHTVKMAYQTNTATEVKKLRAVATWNSTSKVYDIAFVSEGNYAAGQLYKTITKDENAASAIYIGTSVPLRLGTAEEFKNKEGQVILKRTFTTSENILGTTYLALDTYYVYDQFGNLTYVLPPIALGVFNDDTCYQYKYDSRNRMAEKRLPGKQWEFMVYDTLDRVVATGPAASPFADGSIGWTYNYYDYFNRTAVTGWYPVAAGTIFNSALRNTLQQQVNLTSYYHSVSRTVSSSVDNITIGYELRGLVPDGFKLLTVSYYDDYAFPGGPTPPTSSTQIETQKVLVNTKGLATGAWVRVLSGPTLNNATVSYTFYDGKTRAIRTNGTNYLGGYNQSDTKFDFDGSALYTINRHKKSSATTDAVLTTTDTFTYTAQDRLLSHTHKIGTATELMGYNTYNALGQLTQKKVGGSDVTGSGGLQYIDYSYNIRGWLKGINDINTLSPSTRNPQDLFAFKINYTGTIDQSISGNVEPLYNGNIAETSWRTASDNIQRRYGYTYDAISRLTDAWYQIPQASVPIRNSYDEHLSYDRNGNITELQRNGDSDTETLVKPIDNLIYTYHSSIKNRLIKVTDILTNNPKGFLDGTNAGDDYEYDTNGNLTKDNNKNITSISYNHLNMPVKIIFTNGQIEYLYDAAGAKLKKTVTTNEVAPNSNITVTDYFGGYQYTNDVLEFFPTTEGYVKNTVVSGVNKYNYVFNYTDHLGNVRLSYTKDPADNVLKIMEENHYYPFGLKHTGYSADQQILKGGVIGGGIVVLVPVVSPTDITYKYKFQGQERQDELGLNWDSFKWRNYNPEIGRFMSIDPLAEKYAYQSTYQFSSNQPIHAPELEGLESRNDLNLKETTNSQSDAISRNTQLNRTVQLAKSTPATKTSSYNGPTISQGLSRAQYKKNEANAASTEIAKQTVANHDNLGSHYTALRVMEPVKDYLPDMIGGIAAEFTAAVEVTEVIESLGSRASKIHQAVSVATQNRTTIAVADAIDNAGNGIRIVGSSEARLRPAQRSLLIANEIEAVGKGHAEATILNFAENNGYRVSNIGASRPICVPCAEQISTAGATPVTPLI